MNRVSGSNETGSLGGPILLACTVLGGLLFAFAAAATDDPLYRFQALIFVAAAVVGGFALNAAMAAGLLVNDQSKYMDGVVRAGVIATMFWGAVGMLVGVVIAAQLSWPDLLYFPELGWLNFGRLRPLHTSGVIFAFGGNALI